MTFYLFSCTNTLLPSHTTHLRGLPTGYPEVCDIMKFVHCYGVTFRHYESVRELKYDSVTVTTILNH